MSVEYKQRKKWHKKLTRVQDVLCQMAAEVPITRGEAEILCDRISTLQTNLVRVEKLTNKEKRRKVVSLAICNPTLSMSAIARHYGFSEPFVAKVFSEHGKEINEASRKDR